ncbi:peptidase MA family metallohydrolase [Mucilaginibacter celer]|uniref:peptidase MA family metallohydrolase n=1 Tax=Mucilaginibacter celer TaxID=2305508 RepID=UPI0013CE8100|nr:peptidase MA family metallohydrolase [Mucilaginibacter celer]
MAVGGGRSINIISPKTWDKEPCDSRYTDYADRVKTQKLITHELVHVYHGQLNPQTDLEHMKIDWFTEGLAYYASGQLDAADIKDIKAAIAQNKLPKNLDALSNFGLINLRYSISGSVVQYINYKYGRAKLKALLSYTQNSEILTALKITPARLLADWRNYLHGL